MALALMRRHRRWLYVFLWLVIAAFIILYIPAFQKAQRGGHPRRDRGLGGRAADLGRRVAAQPTTRQRAVYERLYQGRLNEAMLRQMGIEEQVLEALVSRAPGRARGEAPRASRVSDEAVARAIAHLARVPGRTAASSAPRSCAAASTCRGTTEEQFADSLRRELLRAEPAGPGGLGGHGQRRRGRARAAPAQRAGEARVRARRRGALPRAGPADATPRSRPASRRRRTRYRIPEKRVVSYVLLDREALRPKVVATDRDIELYYQDHRRSSGRRSRPAPATSWSRSSRARPARGTPRPRRRRSRRACSTQVQAGGDFAAIAKKSSEDQGSAAERRRPRLLRPGPHGARVRRRRRSRCSRARSHGLVKSSFGYHVIRLGSRREATVLPLAHGQGAHPREPCSTAR